MSSIYFRIIYWGGGLPLWLSCKEFSCNAEMQKTCVQSQGWEDPLEEEIVAHFSIVLG